MTGELKDYRFPQRETDILNLVDELNIKDKLVLTGLVREDKLIALIKGATAVIQPTKFEGGAGGGSGYLAKAYGKHLLLSDIEVK